MKKEKIKKCSTKNEMVEEMVRLNKTNNQNLEQKEIILNNFMNAQEIGGKIFLYIPLKYLKVDHRAYQRPAYKHAKTIADLWDERKCDPLIVNYREDGFYYIIDGQHRFKAAQTKGISCLVCRIFVGLSVEEESEIFSDVNILSKKLNPYETFKSNICHGEKVDTIIKNVCDKYGISVENKKDIKTLRCLTACRRIVRRDLNSGDGTKTLDWIFGVLDECAWSRTEPMTYTYRVIGALDQVRTNNVNILNYVRNKLVSVFNSISFEELSAFTKLEYPYHSLGGGFIVTVNDIIDEKIEVINNTKKRIVKVA